MAEQVNPESPAKRKTRGPMQNRSCTDVLCLLLFIAFLCGWGVVGYFGFITGDPQRLVHPTDSEGRICGIHDDVKDKPYLFFFDLTRCANPTVLTTGCHTPQVCVSACPNETFSAINLLNHLGKTQDVRKKLICKYNVSMTAPISFDTFSKGDCASYYIRSTPVAGRCIPDLGVELMEELVFRAEELGNEDHGIVGRDITIFDLVNSTTILAEFLNARQVVERIFQDFSNSWGVILIGLLVSMILSLLWVILMRWISGIMVWISIIAVLALQCVGCWYCFVRYESLKDVPGSNLSLTEIAFTTNLDTYLALRDTWLIFLILLAIFLAITLLLLIFLRSRIRLAIALIGQASRAVGDIMSTLFFPIFPWFLEVLVIGYFVAVAVYLASAGKASYKIVGLIKNENCHCPLYENGSFCIPSAVNPLCNCPHTCQFFEYDANSDVFRLQIYNLFALFWGLFFVNAMGEMVLAGTFASWYWTFTKKDVPFFALTGSLGRTFRYHLGTVAFGSLIISIIRSIRVLLEYIDKKVREYQENCCSKVVLCLCKCCFWCLEKFMRFINRNAYIMCAVYGYNFCNSAKEAFSLLLRNVVRVVVLDKVTDFLLFLGRMVVVGTIGAASFYVFSGRFAYFEDHIPTLNYYLIPVITTTLGAFFISNLFFSVYAMAIDTLFLCFLEDCEQNDGSVEKPYYMPKNLMEILGKKNKV